MNYQNAMSYQRFLAFFIDFLILNFIASFILSFIPLYDFHYTQLIDLYTAFLQTADLELEVLIKMLNSATTCLLLQSAALIPLIILYQVVLPMFWKSQTIGRLIAGVRVMRLESNKKLNFPLLLLREVVVGYFLNTMFIQSLIIPLLNYIFSRNRGRTLADRISKTRLVDYKLAKLMGVDDSNYDDEFINAEYEEVNSQNNLEDQQTDTEYKVF